eukprot:6984913-Prymnesium_polylepis.1
MTSRTRLPVAAAHMQAPCDRSTGLSGCSAAARAGSSVKSMDGTGCRGRKERLLLQHSLARRSTFLEVSWPTGDVPS